MKLLSMSAADRLTMLVVIALGSITFAIYCQIDASMISANSPRLEMKQSPTADREF